MSRLTAALLLAGVAGLAGCASSEAPPDAHAQCDLRIQHESKTGSTDECALWSMTASARQRMLFEQSRLLDPYLNRAAQVQSPWNKPR